jgi:hypothetical protein
VSARVECPREVTAPRPERPSVCGPRRRATFPLDRREPLSATGDPAVTSDHPRGTPRMMPTLALRPVLTGLLVVTFAADLGLLALGVGLAPFFIVLWPLYLAVFTGMLACLLALRWGPRSSARPDAPSPPAHNQAALALSLIVSGFLFLVAALGTLDLDRRISLTCLLNLFAVTLAWLRRPWT